MLICVSGGIVVAAKSRLKMVNVSTTSQNILSVLIPELNAHIISAYKRVHLKKNAKTSSMSWAPKFKVVNFLGTTQSSLVT